MPNLECRIAIMMNFFSKVVTLASAIIVLCGCESTSSNGGLKCSQEFAHGYNNNIPYHFFYVVKVMFDQNNLYFSGDIEGSLPMPYPLRQYLESFKGRTCLVYQVSEYYVIQPNPDVREYRLLAKNGEIMIGKIFAKVPLVTSDVARTFFITELNARITAQLNHITGNHDFSLKLVPSGKNEEYLMQSHLKELK